MSEEQKKEPPRNIGYRHSPHTNLVYRFVSGDERNPFIEEPKAVAQFNPESGELMYLCEDHRRFHAPLMRVIKQRWNWEVKSTDYWKGEGEMQIPEEPEPLNWPHMKPAEEEKPEPLKEEPVVLEADKPKEPEMDRSGMPEMPSSHDRARLCEWVKKWWPSVPTPPQLTWDCGDKTPAFVNWISLYFPVQFRERYGVIGDGEVEETVTYKDSEGVMRKKKVAKKALIAARKTNLTETKV